MPQNRPRIPADVERQVLRNRFITRKLQGAVRARCNAEVTRRLNELFADPELAGAQIRTASALDVAGTDWSDELW